MNFHRFAALVFFVLIDIFLTADGAIGDDIARCEICGIDAPLTKIMNGFEATIGKYPWIVSIRQKGGNNFCMGSIISSRYILTAAHCIDTKHADDILIGLQDERELNLVDVNRLIVHPFYSRERGFNDVALIELKEAIQCDRIPKPLCLHQEDLSQLGQDLVIAGYGHYNHFEKSTEGLTESLGTQVPAIECNVEFDYGNILCAKGVHKNKGPCEGDSGATIVKRENMVFYGIGITSIGPDDCTSNRIGVIYANVHKYISWIKEYVQNLPQPKNAEVHYNDPGSLGVLHPYSATLGVPQPAAVIQ